MNKYPIITFVLILTLSFGFAIQAQAFIGPSAGQSPGSGGGLFTADPNRNIGFGSASGTPSTKAESVNWGHVFTIASSTNPGLALRNVTAGREWVWYAINSGNFGLWDTTAGAVRLMIDTTGRVGVGTTTPAELLHVYGGNIKTSGSFIGTLSGAVSAANVSSDVFGRLQANGNFAFPASVGVATSSKDGLPQPLSVYGNTYISGNVGIGTTAPGNTFVLKNDGTIAWEGVTGNEHVAIRSSSADDLQFLTTATTRMTISSSTGNVGIGTTGPTQPFHIANAATSSIRLQGDTDNDAGEIGTAYIIFEQDNSLVQSILGTIQGTGVDPAGNTYTGVLTNSTLFGTLDSNGALQFGTNDVVRMTVTTAGNVGIATTTPNQPLQVHGIIYSSTGGFKFPDGTTQTSAAGASATEIAASQVTGGTLGSGFVNSSANYSFRRPATTTAWAIIDATNERVGIGTTGPGVKLDVVGGIRASQSIQAYAGGATGFVGLVPGNSVSPGYVEWFRANGSTRIAYLGYSDGGATNLGLNLENTASFNINGGNVGIGTAAPGARLDITRTGATQCCASQTPTLSLAEIGSNTYPWLQFHSSGFQEAFMRLASSSRIFEFGDSQSVGVRLAILNNAATSRVVEISGNSSSYFNGGNVGIGDASPASLLTVGSGDLFQVNSSGIVRGPDGSISAPAYSFTGSTGTGIYWSPALGNFGFSVSGFDKMWIRSGVFETVTILSTEGTPIFSVYRSATTASGNPVVEQNFDGRDAVGSRKSYARIVAVAEDTTDTSQDGSFRIETLQAGTLTEHFKIASGGQVQLANCASTCLLVGGGTGKIDAGTVDPIYTIGGKRYATYMAGMTGVKEETTGVFNLQNKQYVIDFNNLEEGSDLWLFGQTVNVDGRSFIAGDGKVHRTTAEELFDNMTILLSPGFDGRVWYEKDVQNKKITIFADKNGEVSYRLTAPRFDWKGWSNRSDAEHEGFNLDNLLE